MRSWRGPVFAAAVLTASAASAATELHSDASFRGLPALDAAAPDDRVDPADESLFAVNEAALENRTSSFLPAARDRFGWTFLLIAFAGLTAVFAGKRSGGRGLYGA